MPCLLKIKKTKFIVVYYEFKAVIGIHKRTHIKPVKPTLFTDLKSKNQLLIDTSLNLAKRTKKKTARNQNDQ